MTTMDVNTNPYKQTQAIQNQIPVFILKTSPHAPINGHPTMLNVQLNTANAYALPIFTYSHYAVTGQ